MSSPTSPSDPNATPNGPTKIVATTKSTASLIGDVRTIAVAVVAVVATIFFAGVYYRDALAEIDRYKNKLDAAERQAAATSAELQALKSSLNAIFVKFVSEVDNTGSVILNAEPRNNGGGFSPDRGQGRCPQGAFVVGIQPFKHSDGTRQINFQCGKLPNVEIK